MTQHRSPRVALGALLVLVVVAWPGAGAGRATAAALTFDVTTTTDAHDMAPGDGVCASTAGGACTLRAAIEEANAQPPGSSIAVVVPGGTYTLTLGSLELLTNTLTIDGAGAATTIVDGGGANRVALVGPGSTATLDGVTLTGGNAGPNAYGGGVLSAGLLTLRNSVVRGNTAGSGGGLANSGGHLTVQQSRISGNVALYYGGGGIQNGGLQNLAGAITVLASTVDHNVASGGDGGGILNGQNGHPAGAGVLTAAARAYCAQIPRCASAAGQGTGSPPAGAPGSAGAALAPYPLTLAVVASRIADNNGGNSGGGITNDGGRAVVMSTTLTANASPGAIGGGISSYGILTVQGSTLSHNQAVYGGGIEVFGGGISGGLTVISSTLSANTANIGGGVDVSGAFATLSGSTLSGNTAAGGGGVEVEGSSGATLLNSTVSGNTAPGGAGGGLQTYACGTGTLSYVTLAANSSALDLSCPDVTLTGTIVAGSTGGANCVGARPTEGAGYNLDSGASCGFSQATDLTTTNPLLGPLAANGGPTPTRALLPGSPAIDHGGSSATGCPPTDQRGVSRPQGAACDMGAYEFP